MPTPHLPFWSHLLFDLLSHLSSSQTASHNWASHSPPPFPLQAFPSLLPGSPPFFKMTSLLWSFPLPAPRTHAHSPSHQVHSRWPCSPQEPFLRFSGHMERGRSPPSSLSEAGWQDPEPPPQELRALPTATAGQVIWNSVDLDSPFAGSVSEALSSILGSSACSLY